jgi:hypothetical protein
VKAQLWKSRSPIFLPLAKSSLTRRSLLDIDRGTVGLRHEYTILGILYEIDIQLPIAAQKVLSHSKYLSNYHPNCSIQLRDWGTQKSDSSVPPAVIIGEC